MENSITFKVAGMSPQNDSLPKQDILRKIYLRESPYGSVTYTFKRYEYNDDLAIAVYANDEQIGDVPHELVQQFNLLWTGSYTVSPAICEEGGKSWSCELAVKFEQEPAPLRTPRPKKKVHENRNECRRCPVCGNRLRKSQKDPKYGLCDVCAKKIPWLDEDDYEVYRPASHSASSSSKPRFKTKRNVCAIISLVLSLAYLGYCAYYWGGIVDTGANTAEQFGSAIAAVLVFPHLIATAVAFIFNAVGVIIPSRWFVLVGAILYAVAIALFFAYFMFVIVQMILSFVGFAFMKPVRVT